MRNSKRPAFLPVDHRANLSGNRTGAKAASVELAPWPVRRRIGVYVVLALTAWIIALSPFLLIN
jgi:hypothetical protein